MDNVMIQLMRHEGSVKENGLHRMYKCPAGFNTIGYGHNVDAHPLKGAQKAYYEKNGGLDDTLVNELLRDDTYAVFNQLDSLYDWFDELDEVRQDVLVNMGFNLGMSGLSKFKKMLAAVEAGEYKHAADEMTKSLWYKQVGNRAKELVEQMRTGER